jgi:hypothetical protein
MTTSTKMHKRTHLFSRFPAFAGIAGMCIALMLCSSTAFANACYSPQEFDADRGLRLHTDMEVIALTCKYGSYSKPLMPIYAQFTHKNAKTLRGWEDVVARAHPEMGRSRNEVIDNFRTALANQKGNEAARMTPRQFCIHWANFVVDVASWPMPKILDYIHQQDSARPTRKPLC